MSFPDFKRYIVSDDNGRDIFYFSLINNYYSRIYLSNLKDLNTYPYLIPLLREICDVETKKKRLAAVIEELFNRIKQIIELEQYYLPEYFLNKDGKFCEPAFKVISQMQQKPIQEQQQVEAFVPYTSTINTPLFNQIVIVILDSFNQQPKFIKLTKIEPVVFQNNLRNDALIDAYLDNYNFQARYYCAKDKNHTCLVMYDKKEIKMLFFTWVKIDRE